jgi:Nucleoside-diphosphate-sugar pyrophosphorylase involved in lipopolysaccharide biosynthesis/translation initiation factor 2B, gamma/epsilon subunits (eIF-2Bgamma/eIF-2Bepsilon)
MRFGIISAGEGSRLASEGFSQPKPLVPICGVPMIERLVRIMQGCGADKIAVIVNGENPETVSLLKSLPVDLVVKKTPTPMHSMMELAPYLEGDSFCVTTVDTVFSESRFRTMMDEFSKSPLDGLMGVTSLIDDEKPLYVDVDGGMMIKGFHDLQDGCRYVSAGIYALKTRALDVLKGCLDSGQTRMRYFQRQLLEAGMQLKAFDMGQVVDVDHVSDVTRAQEIAKL